MLCLFLSYVVGFFLLLEAVKCPDEVNINRNECKNIGPIVYLFEHILLTYSELTLLKSLWRNRLARQTVNLKVGGSSPPRDVSFCPHLLAG